MSFAATHPIEPPANEIVVPGRGELPHVLKSQALDDLTQLLGGTPAPGDGLDSPWLPVWRVKTRHTLVHEGARQGHVFVVRSGIFKCSRVWEDGYEHVLGFASRGDVIGLDGLHCRSYLENVIALDEATVYALPVDELESLRRKQPAFEQALAMAASRQLAHAAQVTEVLVAVSSDTRLARFLLMYAQRLIDRGESGRRLHLPMPRRGLANMLGVAYETVSRSFHALANVGCLRVDNREVEILDMPALVERTRTTRRPRAEVLAQCTAA